MSDTSRVRSGVASYGPALVGLAALAAAWGRTPPLAVAVLLIGLLMAAVMSAVHHAEVVAARVGEPFGSLVLAVAVTVIEVGLVVTLMVSDPTTTGALARDTVFAAVMITCNVIVGAALLVQAVCRRTAIFNSAGTGAALAMVITVSALCLVLPRFTRTTPGPVFTSVQLVFAAVVSLALYGLFVFVQNVRHRDYFLPPAVHPQRSRRAYLSEPRASAPPDDDDLPHAQPPSTRETVVSATLLVAALATVVGLAKVESQTIEDGVAAAGLPQSFVGVLIALLILLPETIAAVRNALRDRVQISLNLALGSAMASIGLTIPTIAVASIWVPGRLVLGLEPLQITLLVLTALVGTLSVIPGRATVVQAYLHLVIGATFLFFAAYP